MYTVAELNHAFSILISHTPSEQELAWVVDAWRNDCEDLMKELVLLKPSDESGSDVEYARLLEQEMQLKSALNSFAHIPRDSGKSLHPHIEIDATFSDMVCREESCKPCYVCKACNFCKPCDYCNPQNASKDMLSIYNSVQLLGVHNIPDAFAILEKALNSTAAIDRPHDTYLVGEPNNAPLKIKWFPQSGTIIVGVVDRYMEVADQSTEYVVVSIKFYLDIGGIVFDFVANNRDGERRLQGYGIFAKIIAYLDSQKCNYTYYNQDKRDQGLQATLNSCSFK